MKITSKRNLLAAMAILVLTLVQLFIFFTSFKMIYVFFVILDSAMLVVNLYYAFKKPQEYTSNIEK